MKTLSFKFEQFNNYKTTKTINKGEKNERKETNERLEIVTFETQGNLCLDGKADNLQRTINFCSELFKLLDVMQQSNKAIYVNGQKFRPSKEFNLYAIIDGKEHCLNYSNLIQFDSVGFKISNPTLRKDKNTGAETLNTNSRKAFALQVWQLLQGAENKTQLMNKSNISKISTNAQTSAQHLIA
jgi:hypothetical protein